MRIYIVISLSFFSPQSFHVSINIQVLCVVGDVSFLHDTNGLAILNQRYENERKKYILVFVLRYLSPVLCSVFIYPRSTMDSRK